MLVKVDAQGPWRAGNELLVCTMAKVAVTGLSPLPSDGIVRSLVVTRIEEDAGPAEDGSGYADTPLNGQSWSWCA
jgi:hypothetical protein